MKTRVTDKEPNNFCRDFLHISLSSGSNSLSRLWFPPLATTGHSLLPFCASVCVRGVSFGLALCLANYVLVLEPSPRPWPLPPSSQQTALHSTTLSECLSHYRSSLAHENRSEGGNQLPPFFSFFFSSNPPKNSIFASVFLRLLTYLSCALACPCTLCPRYNPPFFFSLLWSKLLIVVNIFRFRGWVSVEARRPIIMPLDLPITSWWRTSAGLRNPIKRQIMKARKQFKNLEGPSKAEKRRRSERISQYYGRHPYRSIRLALSSSFLSLSLYIFLFFPPPQFYNFVSLTAGQDN